MKLAVVDYGMGNIKSVCNAFAYLGAKPVIADTPSKLNADKIVIPGVGSFGEGVKNLAPFIPKIRNAVNSGTPVLGICLGLHMFLEVSEESPEVQGMGLIKGGVKKLQTRMRLPHMGWNSIRIKKKRCPLFRGINGDHVYFVHTYHPVPKENVVAATARYGCEVNAAVWKDNLYGTQFHPEKSGKIGLRLLENFLEL
ncbi:MAG: imidazole glycerol phosphate synthase subunit HisH [Hadesarchaea archaeon]|nr:MAG: imidazole glycerol phosphate synthase subunit HisH [Hadesarchaea archaeon]